MTPQLLLDVVEQRRMDTVMNVLQHIEPLLVAQPNIEMNSCVVRQLLNVVEIAGWWHHFKIAVPQPNPSQFVSMIASPQDIIRIHVRSSMPVWML